MSAPASKRVLVLFNPISGSGRGPALATALADRLARRGHTVESAATTPEPTRLRYSDLDAVVVCGGDGTLLNLLPELIRTRVPVYMLPAGNESLFAAKLGMPAEDLRAAVGAVERNKAEEHFVGFVNETPFFTMASIGFDADVVAHVARNRKGPAGNRGYVLPVLSALVSHRPPRLRLAVDGKTVLDGSPGTLIVANTSAYALGVSLVPEADSLSPQLVARFFPYSTSLGFPLVAARALASRGGHWPWTSVFRGNIFRVEATAERFVQADGDPVGTTPAVIRKTDARIAILRG